MNSLTARMPSAPGMFSMTTGWPQRTGSCSAKSRAETSTEVPAGSGMMTLTVRSGHASADGGSERARKPAIPMNRDRIAVRIGASLSHAGRRLERATLAATRPWTSEGPVALDYAHEKIEQKLTFGGIEHLEDALLTGRGLRANSLLELLSAGRQAQQACPSILWTNSTLE